MSRPRILRPEATRWGSRPASLRLIAVVLSVVVLSPVFVPPVSAQEVPPADEVPASEPSDDPSSLPSNKPVDGAPVPGTGLSDALSAEQPKPVRPPRGETPAPVRNERVGSDAARVARFDVSDKVGEKSREAVVPAGGRVEFADLPVAVEAVDGELRSVSVRSVTGDVGSRLSVLGVVFDISAERLPAIANLGRSDSPLVVEFDYSEAGSTGGWRSG